MNKGKLITRQALTGASELHVREGEGESGRKITGYAILFGIPSVPLWTDEDGNDAREVIDPGAVTRELLDGSDIKFTMFHDRQLILARSNKGNGTLSYGIDQKGVYFEFEAPATEDGNKALELVRRGDLAGCSFAFSTYYYDPVYVSETRSRENGVTHILYTVRQITGIYDFTLAADPAYPDTSVEARELAEGLRSADKAREAEKAEREREIEKQLSEMRRAAKTDIFNN